MGRALPGPDGAAPRQPRRRRPVAGTGLGLDHRRAVPRVAEAEHYAGQGVAVVEMEAAALFAVAEVRGIEVAAAFAISDSLADGEWVPHFADARLATSLLRMVPAAVDTLLDPG